ncbi:MAG: hypothetical protein LBQ43_01085 [Holosporales bacterium]|nr:hypothetical protein [Holosporales bacterium]
MVVLLTVCNAYADESITDIYQQNQNQFVSSEAENFVRAQTGEVYLVVGDSGTWRFNENYWFFFDKMRVPSNRGVVTDVENVDAWEELSSKFPDTFSMIFDDFRILTNSANQKSIIGHCIKLLKPGGVIIGQNLFGLLFEFDDDDVDNIFRTCEIYRIKDTHELVKRIPWGTGSADSLIFSCETHIKYVASLINKERARNKESPQNVQPKPEPVVEQLFEGKSAGELICSTLSEKEQDSILKALYFIEHCRPNNRIFNERGGLAPFNKKEIAIFNELAGTSESSDLDKLRTKATSVVSDAVKNAVKCLKNYWNIGQITRGLESYSADEVKKLIKQRKVVLQEYLDGPMEEDIIDPTPYKEWYVFIKKTNVVDSEA